MIKLKEDETILLRAERSYRAYLVWLALACVVVAADFLFVFWLLQWGDRGLVAFVALLALGLLIAQRTLAQRARNIMLITDQRIVDIDKSGWFSKEITELTYDLIEDVTVRQKGISHTLMRLGTLVVIGSHGNMRIEFKHLTRPVEVQELVLDARERFMDTKRYGRVGAQLDAQNRPAILMREMKMLSYKQLMRLKEAVDARVRQYERELAKRKGT